MGMLGIIYTQCSLKGDTRGSESGKIPSKSSQEKTAAKNVSSTSMDAERNT
jgi:hypothetical protein